MNLSLFRLVQIGVHKGEVDNVKVWFLHNNVFFNKPYQNENAGIRLKILALLAKAFLPLCKLSKLIPSLVISNDSPTGYVRGFE
jgi:hypothetical protein